MDENEMDDAEAEAYGEEWDVAATRALAELIRACGANPHSPLHQAAAKAANAMADAIARYHEPEPEVRH